MNDITVVVRFAGRPENVPSFGSRLPNPGVGGTQFLSIQLAAMLAELMPDWRVQIITNAQFSIDGTQNLHVKSIDCFSKYLLEAQLWELGVIISPTRVLKDLDKCVLSRIASRTIAHSHHLNDYSLVLLERIVTFAAVACVSKYHYYTTASRSPKIFLRNMVAPNWGSSVAAQCGIERNADLELVFVGALTSDKGILSVAKSWKVLRKSFDSVRLHVIGGSATHGKPASHEFLPTDRATGKRILRHIPIEDIGSGRVLFHGNMGGNKAEIMRLADAAVLNLDNHRESFCLAAYECLSLGVPVVGSQAGALREVMTYFPELVVSNGRRIVDPLADLASDSAFRNDITERCFSVSRSVQSKNASILNLWAEAVKTIAERQPVTFAGPKADRPSVMHLESVRAQYAVIHVRRMAMRWLRLVFGMGVRILKFRRGCGSIDSRSG